MRLHGFLPHELRRAVDVARPGDGIRLIGLCARAGEDIVRADVEELYIPLRGKAGEDLCSRCVDETAAGGLILCLVDRRVCCRMENGVGGELVEHRAHRLLIREGEHPRGDTVYLVPACLALLYAVIAELAACACDEDFHCNPAFLF